jgi:hypothetical protein
LREWQPKPEKLHDKARELLAKRHGIHDIFWEKDTKHTHVPEQPKYRVRNNLRTKEISNYLNSFWTGVSSRTFPVICSY